MPSASLNASVAWRIKAGRCAITMRVTGRLATALQDAQRINGVPILTKPLDFRRLGRLLSEPPS